jgi:hypothetical protein
MPGTVQLPVDESLAALVTIIRAARLTGDDVMERIAQQKLWDRYRVRVAFNKPRQRREDDHARR